MAHALPDTLLQTQQLKVEHKDTTVEEQLLERDGINLLSHQAHKSLVLWLKETIEILLSNYFLGLVEAYLNCDVPMQRIQMAHKQRP
jgi:hypothetical protein